MEEESFHATRLEKLDMAGSEVTRRIAGVSSSVCACAPRGVRAEQKPNAWSQRRGESDGKAIANKKSAFLLQNQRSCLTLCPSLIIRVHAESEL